MLAKIVDPRIADINGWSLIDIEKQKITMMSQKFSHFRVDRICTIVNNLTIKDEVLNQNHVFPIDRGI